MTSAASCVGSMLAAPRSERKAASSNFGVSASPSKKRTELRRSHNADDAATNDLEKTSSIDVVFVASFTRAPGDHVAFLQLIKVRSVWRCKAANKSAWLKINQKIVELLVKAQRGAPRLPRHELGKDCPSKSWFCRHRMVLIPNQLARQQVMMSLSLMRICS